MVRFPKGTTGLMQRYGEVEFLLRQPMKSDQEIVDTHAVATSSIKVLNLIKEKAQSLGCLQGEVSRALMPFGVETSAGD
jgi:hypothetical protein